MSLISREAPPQSGQRYDLADYINPQALQAMSGERFDAAQTAFFLRDLTEVMGRTFDVKYPDLKIRQILPVWTGLDPASEGYVWRQYDRNGTAKVIDDYAADLPNTEIVAKEFQSRCLSIGASYQYSIMDLRRARMAGAAGIPLETRKALAARRSIEQAFEQIGFFGVAQVPGTSDQAMAFAPVTQNTNDPMAMYGFTNFPGLTVKTTTLDWTAPSTSVTGIVNDFNLNLFLSIINASKGVHTPDSVVLPLSIWSHLTSTPRSPTFTDDTILQYLQKENPWLKNLYWSNLLETAGLKQDNTTPGPRIMAFERNEENIQLVVPQEFEQLPPQMVNFMFKIPCHFRVGGVRVSYPKSIVALDGAAG